MSDELYQNYFEDLKNEFFSAVKEGAEEGIKEGVKDGIIDGLSECFDLGFLNISTSEVKEIDEILMDAAEETIEENIQNAVKKQLCPVLKAKLQNLCDAALKEIKDYKITVDADVIDLAEKSNIEEMAESKMEEIEEYINQNLPQNFMFTTIFNGLEKGTSECLIDNISICAERIKDAVIIKNSG